MCYPDCDNSVTLEQNTLNEGHLLLISQAKAFLTYSKKSLRFSTLAAAKSQGVSGCWFLELGQCHGPQEGSSLKLWKDSHAGPQHLQSQEFFLVSATYHCTI